jgi:hypothetical protein
MTDKTNKAIAGEVVDKPPKKAKKESKGVIKLGTSLIAGITTKELKISLDTQTQARKLVKEFVEQHLEEGVDYGRIHIKKDCNFKYELDKCKNPGHWSKNTLFKPGQEKIFSLFSITAKLTKDMETLEMLGTSHSEGLIALKADLYRGDTWIGEGRGACAVGGQPYRDANSAIKIAQKRARMDGCLSLGFSEYFSQDLEDPEYRDSAAKASEAQAAAYERANPFGLDIRDRNLPADNSEKQVLIRLLNKRGITSSETQLAAMHANGITDPGKMTSGEIRDLINLAKTKDFVVSLTKQDTVVEDIGEEEIGMSDIPDFGTDSPAPVVSKPDILVDDELIANVQENFAIIDLNTRGKQWFMRTVTGAPFKPIFEDFKDSDWRKAYELVNDLLDNNVEIPGHYFGNAGGSKQRPLNFSESTKENEEAQPDDLGIGGQE